MIAVNIINVEIKSWLDRATRGLTPEVKGIVQTEMIDHYTAATPGRRFVRGGCPSLRFG